MLAVMMSNAGGAWDNCKKYIENEKVYGGKKSDTHKACVVGDTVGDPFKDTLVRLEHLDQVDDSLLLTLAPVFRGDWETYEYGLIVLAVEILLVALAYWWVWIKNSDEVFTPNDEKHKKTTSD